MVEFTPLQPANVAVPTACFVPGIVTGPWVFISGQVALMTDNTIYAPGDVAEQTRYIIQNNFRSILELAGGSLTDIVSTTVFMRSFERYRAFDDAWTEAMAGHAVARAVVQGGLLRPEIEIEVQATALLSS
jgi:enamine deaminase RidA (YjgF/YER057c/UK114 family)